MHVWHLNILMKLCIDARKIESDSIFRDWRNYYTAATIITLQLTICQWLLWNMLNVYVKLIHRETDTIRLTYRPEKQITAVLVTTADHVEYSKQSIFVIYLLETSFSIKITHRVQVNYKVGNTKDNTVEPDMSSQPCDTGKVAF